jgi:hypothetical protein
VAFGVRQHARPESISKRLPKLIAERRSVGRGDRPSRYPPISLDEVASEVVKRGYPYLRVLRKRAHAARYEKQGSAERC